MFDVVTYALLKKAFNESVTGIKNVEFVDGKLVFILADNNKIEVPIDLKGSDVKTISIDENQQLIVEFQDGTSLTFAPATQQQLAAAKEKISNLENSYNDLNAAQDTLIEAQKQIEQLIDDLSLSVVDGKLNVTFIEGE